MSDEKKTDPEVWVKQLELDSATGEHKYMITAASNHLDPLGTICTKADIESAMSAGVAVHISCI